MWPFGLHPPALQGDVDRGGEDERGRESKSGRERKCDLVLGYLSEAGERQRALWFN